MWDAVTVNSQAVSFTRRNKGDAVSSYRDTKSMYACIYIYIFLTTTINLSENFKYLGAIHIYLNTLEKFKYVATHLPLLPH
jgi:hypothetical protein